METNNISGLWRIIRHTSDGDIAGPWMKNQRQERTYDLAMALLCGESGRQGFQYLAIGTGNPAWGSSPPNASPTATKLYPEVPPAQQERIIFTNNPTGGNFRLSFQGQLTPTISYDPTAPGSTKARVIQVMLEALSTIGTGNVLVQAEGGESYLVTFQGALGSGSQELIATVTTELTHSGSLVPDISVTLANSPLSNTLGELARFPIDNITYIDENGVPLVSGISRYSLISARIPSGVFPSSSGESPIVFREMAWVGGGTATTTIGTGMYLYIIRFPPETRRFGDDEITIQSRLAI